MVLKIIAAIAVIAACSKMGFDFAGRLARRERELQGILLGLNLLETEITFRAAPLGDALLSAAKGANGVESEIFTKCGEALNKKNGTTAGNAWREAVDAVRERLALTREDTEVVKSLAAGFGGSDAVNQMASILLTKNRIEDLRKTAAAETTKLSKMYRSCGVLIGIFLAVMFA